MKMSTNSFLTRINVTKRLQNLLDAKGSGMITPPGLPTYLRPHVTLTFNPKVHCFVLLCWDYFCQLASKSVHPASKYRIHKFIKDKQKDEQFENITCPPASLLWRTYNSSTNQMNNVLTRKILHRPVTSTTQDNGIWQILVFFC